MLVSVKPESLKFLSKSVGGKPGGVQGGLVLEGAGKAGVEGGGKEKMGEHILVVLVKDLGWKGEIVEEILNSKVDGSSADFSTPISGSTELVLIWEFIISYNF